MKFARISIIISTLFLVIGGVCLWAGDQTVSGPVGRGQDAPVFNKAYVPNSQTAPSGYKPTLTAPPPAISLPRANGTVAILKDVDPWDSVAAEAIFTSHGVPYEVHTSSEFAALNFSNFVMIVVCSDQPQGFYDAYAVHQAKFADYVSNGGFLNFFAADDGWQDGNLTAPLPGGIFSVHMTAQYNYIVDPSHPVVGCAPNPIYGNSASHNYFTNVPAGAQVIVEIGGMVPTRQAPPTLLEYKMGFGTMLASTMTLEISYDWGWDAAVIYENALLYGYGLATCTPFDLIYVDEFGRSKLCVNSATGEFLYTVLTGTGAGEYPGQAVLSMRNGVLFINSTTMSPRLQFYDNQRYHKAYGSYTSGAVRSYLDDRNTTNNPAMCNEPPPMPEPDR